MKTLDDTKRFCDALIAGLADYYHPLPPARGNDWLVAHKEPGQPFSSVATELSFNKQPATSIEIHLFHTIDFSQHFGHLLPRLRTFLQAYFQVRSVAGGVVAVGAVPRRNRPHRQLRTKELAELLPVNASVKALCLTSDDLHPAEEGYNFVFGEAFPPRAVVSTFHCGFDSHQQAEIPLTRLLKMVAHEVGHLFHFDHCSAFLCNMNGRNSMDEVDRQPFDFCPDCIAKLVWVSGIRVGHRFEQLRRICAEFELKKEAERFDLLAKAIGAIDRQYGPERSP